MSDLNELLKDPWKADSCEVRVSTVAGSFWLATCCTETFARAVASLPGTAAELQRLRDENANLAAACSLADRRNERLLEALKEFDRLLVFSVPPKIGEELILNEALANALLNARAAIAESEGREEP